jgi:hypothetical protein
MRRCIGSRSCGGIRTEVDERQAFDSRRVRPAVACASPWTAACTAPFAVRIEVRVADKDTIPGARRRKKARGAPDAALARAPGVEYRYTLAVVQPSEARGIFQIADELGAVVRYLLLVNDTPHHRYRAYLGLGSSDCFDLPLRLAARGIHIERGEQTSDQSSPPPENVTVLRRR